MRFHLLSLPHTETTSQYVSCAYTEKVRKLSTLLTARGHEVFLYAGEENEADCTEHITVATREDQKKWFGEPDPGDFYPITWGPDEEHWVATNRRAIAEIGRRWEKRDRVLITAGCCQAMVANTFEGSIEHGIGYRGVCNNTFRCYESYAWMHFVQGLRDDDDGHDYDVVIPNYFDVNDFPMAKEKGDYLLFIGRFVLRKGPHIAAEIAHRAGLPIVMAGQGVREQRPGLIVGDEVAVTGDHVTHVGPVNAQERGELMSKARAVIVPTTYLEPFGGVNVEAQLCGTPVITTDYGAFPETVIDHVTGYRFRTLGEAVWGVNHTDDLDPVKIRHIAQSRYSMERAGQRYEAWFRRIDGLWDPGRDWYTEEHEGTSEFLRYVA